MHVQHDETDLIQRAKALDEAALATLYERYYQGIYRYVYYRVSDSALAEDLCGDIFLKMLHGITSYSIQGIPFSAWLYRIARNRVIDHLRRQPAKADLPLDEARVESIEAEDNALEGALSRDELVKALRVLTEEQKQVILLKFVEDMDNLTIAAVLGKTEGAVKSLQHRALDSLRRHMQKAQ